MNLQEFAFMISLINANYHRRMVYLLCNVIAIIVPIFVLIMSWKNLGLYAYVMSTIFACGIVRMLIVYVAVDENQLPFFIKHRQMSALRQHYNGKGIFEDLKYHVPLHEYFDR